MQELTPSYHFQTAIYQAHRPDWVSTVLNICEPYYQNIRSQGPYKKIFPQYQTDNLQSEASLSFFQDFIIQAAAAILNEQGYDLSKHELCFEEMWAQEVHTYGHHFTHVHGNSHISGFYFLECPENGMYPLFYDPRPGKTMTDLPEKNDSDITLASHTCNYKPQPGMFMFFNSWLPHGFQLNGSNDPCKFVHFNVTARRKYQK